MVNQSFRIVVEVASIDENGIISQPFQAEGTVATNPSCNRVRKQGMGLCLSEEFLYGRR